MNRYDDIINLPHHKSETRRPMPMAARAAQFAPFSALTGHDEAIAETARLTTEKIELTLEEQDRISRRLTYAIEHHLQVSITYFCPDIAKSGGSYTTVTGHIKKVDESTSTLVLDNNQLIPVDTIGVVGYIM